MNVLLNQGIVQRLVRQMGVNDERFVEPNCVHDNASS